MNTIIISAIVAALLLTGVAVGVTQLPADTLPEGVTNVTIQQDYDDGKTHYDVEFHADGKEYDLEVDPLTGEILELETEPIETKPPKAETPAPAPEKKTELLTAAQVEALALADAGLPREQVKGLRTEFEWDDSIPEWEVEFYVGRTEYEYTIHGETGAILDRDIEKD